MPKDLKKQIENRVKLLFSDTQISSTTGVWKTVYSDMMTNLMLFFLMLFALNMVEKVHFEQAARAFRRAIEGKPYSAPVVEEPKTKELNKILMKLMQEEKNIEVIEQGEGVRLRLPEPVLFSSGEAALKPEAKEVLHEIAQGLKKLSNAIVIEGHTDDRPIRGGPFQSNWELSEARAENVLNYLVRVERIPPHRLAVSGYGEYRPFLPNDSPVSRALNRRIEILVISDEE